MFKKFCHLTCPAFVCLGPILLVLGGDSGGGWTVRAIGAGLLAVGLVAIFDQLQRQAIEIADLKARLKD